MAQQKLFQTIRKNLALLGYGPNRTGSKLALVRKHLYSFITSIFKIISFFVYMFRVAETASEFMFSLFWITATLYMFLCFTSTVFKTTALFKCLNYAETLYTQSE